jgi:hypothetical protein
MACYVTVSYIGIRQKMGDKRETIITETFK